MWDDAPSRPTSRYVRFAQRLPIIGPRLFDRSSSTNVFSRTRVDRIFRHWRKYFGLGKKHPPNLDLDTIGVLEGADKSSSMDLHWDYLRHYEKFLRQYRNSEINVIEIGVAKGASLRAWHKYFPLANVVGIDIWPECASQAGDRIFIEIGSQDDPVFLAKVCEKYPPTIIIDDGSHQADHIIHTFERAFPFLRPGGLYIVEDLVFHFPPHFSNRVNGFSPPEYFSALARDCLAGIRGNAAIDAPMAYVKDNIDCVSFVYSSLIIQKKGTPIQTYDWKTIREFIEYPWRGNHPANGNKILVRYISHLAYHKCSPERINEFMSLVERGRLDVEDFLNLSNCQNQLDLWDKDEAENMLVEALTRFPDDFHVTWRLGHIRLRQRKFAAAAETLKRATSMRVDNGYQLVAAYEMLSQAYVEQSMINEAVGALRSALSVNVAAETRKNIQLKIDNLQSLLAR